MYEWRIIVPSFRLNRVSYHDIVRQLRKNLNKLDNYNLYTVNTHTHTHTHTPTVSYTIDTCVWAYVFSIILQSVMYIWLGAINTGRHELGLQWGWGSVQFSSVTQSCPTLCNPIKCSTPGLPDVYKRKKLQKQYFDGYDLFKQ